MKKYLWFVVVIILVIFWMVSCVGHKMEEVRASSRVHHSVVRLD